MNKTLLPNGLYDLLPPDAGHKRRLVERTLNIFERYGYQEVSPPLVEFEETLLSGKGESLAADTFRVLDPVSHRMMAIRPDLTMQVARIAATRLSHDPLPLRLCYAGEVLSVKGSALRGERQHSQAGIEIIGSPAPGADAEVMLIALDTLQSVGLLDITIDLGLPTLVLSILSESGLDKEKQLEVASSISRKDRTLLSSLPAPARSLLEGVIGAAGNLPEAIDKLAKLPLPEDAIAMCAHLKIAIAPVMKEFPDVSFTLDPTEHRGFEYHTGLSFSVFASGIESEVIRGGRYEAPSPNEEEGVTSATGFTMYFGGILRKLSFPDPLEPAAIPIGTPLKQIKKLQSEGFITVFT